MSMNELRRSIRADRRAAAWGIAIGMGVFLLFGLVTGLIPNPLYVRMVPRTPIDYVLLVSTALLAGVYVAQRNATTTSDDETAATTGEGRLAIGGLAGGFLAVGCPICNAFLLALFSSSALMTYFDPIRPVLGVVSVAILAGLIYILSRRSCPTCVS
ncbi:hypothetical protein HWV07_11595 [Natronomonas salina]|uniref:hypothetical protein n=1 Tax=Natronomonas salina TaxID=1710540 RepID=UPI0015B5E1DE|nr:hypothetical protein [Natronomonas salina]QLD89635.1 hypothetical protein HWV07_11595 [Natronomonas salina]